jgi:hypothetical protein
MTPDGKYKYCQCTVKVTMASGGFTTKVCSKLLIGQDRLAGQCPDCREAGIGMFEKGDTVYTPDGTNYYFDHQAGHHGYVSPIIIIQTTSYHGDDFDEHEEVADHMIPIELTRLSKTPWVRKVHEETAAAVKEKQAVLDDINKQIGAANTEMRDTKQRLEAHRKDLEQQTIILARRFQWVKDFMRLIGEDETAVLTLGEGVPYQCKPHDIRLKMDTEDKNKWHYLGMYDDGEEHLRVFATEDEAKRHVWNLFLAARNDMDVEEQIKWHKQWPDLPITGEAQLFLQAKKDEKYDRDLKAAEGRLQQAQDALDKVKKTEPVVDIPISI